MASAPTRSATPAAEPAKEDAGYSGRLLLRMPPALHAELARAAQRDGTSLNGYINGVLSGAREDAPEPDPRLDRASRLIRAAIIADLVLVAVAAAVAVAMLLIAWP